MKPKARDILKIENPKEIWPSRIDWAMQLFDEESPVTDRCAKCGKVLCTYPTDREEYRIQALSPFAPMMNPFCGKHAPKTEGDENG
jgi:hypothetical protein